LETARRELSGCADGRVVAGEVALHQICDGQVWRLIRVNAWFVVNDFAMPRRVSVRVALGPAIRAVEESFTVPSMPLKN
jgi:hypothetical protein